MSIPTYDQDFYADEVILDPHPHYRRMRELGPVVWLPRNRAFALTRYREVTYALRHPESFISSKGVSLNDKVNELIVGNTINSDPPEHDLTRSVTSEPLLPGALPEVERRIQLAAEGLIDRLCARGEFDAVADLAQFLPVTIVAELVGLPDAGRENMLKWASAAFNLFADENPRAREAFRDLRDLRSFLEEYGRPDRLKPNGWARRIFEVGPERGLSYETCAQLMRDYINPSLDTTISATGQIIHLFAENPDQWSLVRAAPELVANAVEEAVRLASPIRAFSRYVPEDTEIAGETIPGGSRVLVVYASANRDERKFADPEHFDVTRDVHDHVGFGHGIHMCMGMHLARLEICSLLHALRRRVTRFRLAGTPEIAMNNTIRAFASLPVRVDVTKIENRSLSPAAVAAESPWLEVEIADRRAIAEGIVALELRAADGDTLPPFEAGSHVDVYVRNGLVRQYSLSNDPAETARYRIAVLLEPGSRGGSNVVHADFRKGGRIRIGRPRNNFPLNAAAGHSLLFAGGIGITPILSMAHALDRSGASFELHYCARTRGKLAFSDELIRFGDRANVHLDSGSESQQLDIHSALAGKGDDWHLYVCGPSGFMDFVIESAHRHGWSDDAIHLERFGAEVNADGAAFTVVAARSNRMIRVNPDETIVGKLAEAGIEVATSCQSGVCGTCLTPVIQGTPDHRDFVQTDAEKANNDRITVCCSRSKTRRLVLDL